MQVIFCKVFQLYHTQRERGTLLLHKLYFSQLHNSTNIKSILDGEIIKSEHSEGTASFSGVLCIAVIVHYIKHYQYCLLLMFIGYRFVSWGKKENREYYLEIIDDSEL